MFLLAQIQLHDHPSVFGVAEVLFAIAAELSVCLCHITAQRLLKLLRFFWLRGRVGFRYPAQCPARVFLPQRQVSPLFHGAAFADSEGLLLVSES